MGAVFTVPMVKVGDLAGDLRALPGAKIALVPGSGVPVAELWRVGPARRDERAKVPPEYGGPEPSSADLTLLVGAERVGLPEQLIAAADAVAHIPIATDSLNAAMAATIALYELRTRMARG
jgi:TrmH family RNA methyltransferase